MRITTSTTRAILRTLAIAVGISSLLGINFAANAEYTPWFLHALDKHGPWGEPRAEFDAFLANNPNATGNYAFPGPNLTRSHAVPGDPDNENMTYIDGWSWSIVVAADIPIKNSTYVPPDDVEGPFFYTGGKLVFNAPSSLVDPNSGGLAVRDDWRMCIFQWQLSNISYSDKLRSDDGTCRSVLSDECIADMKKAVTDSNNINTICVCPISRNIPSCNRLGHDSKVFDSTCSGDPYDASRIRGIKAGREEIGTFGDPKAHHRGNLTRYNKIGTLAWPVMVSFGFPGYATASLSCVRAGDAVAGSIAPIDETSGGNSFGGSWLGIGITIFASMLML